MRRFYRSLVDFTSERELGDALALFRVMVGFALVVNLLATAPHGVLSAMWIDVHHGGYRLLGEGHGIIKLLGGPTPEIVWSVFAVTVAAGFAIIAGLGGRVTALIAAQGLLALSALNGHARGSYDALLSNCLWILVLAPSTATWSLDSKIFHGRFVRDVLVPAWPRRLVIFQLVLVYFSTGLHKISAYWTPAGGFSALYYILQQPNWHRFDMTWLAHVYPLTQVATLSTWLFELGAPLLLFALYRERRRGTWRLYRVAFAAFGVVMHTGVFLFLEVGPFTVIIWALYVTLFRPNEVRACRQRLARARSCRTA